jgi:hypothetical protein
LPDPRAAAVAAFDGLAAALGLALGQAAAAAAGVGGGRWGAEQLLAAHNVVAGGSSADGSAASGGQAGAGELAAPFDGAAWRELAGQLEGAWVSPP